VQGHRVFDDVSWQIFSGDHWGIVGANAAGKSTLLRLVEGTLWPAPGRGRRRYDFGHGVQTDAIEARRRIVTVGPELQNRYARFGWNFRSLDIVRSGLTRSDVPRRNPTDDEVARAGDILARLGLEPLAEQRFLTLSRGQQRRILIARAVAFAPDLLLLDEPASGLDVTARLTLDSLLAEVARSATIIVTAHSRDDLPAIVTRVADLRGGRLLVDAPIDTTHATPPPARIRARPDPAAAALIRVERASVWFDSRAVLRDIDWQLLPGEQWLITGPNGSGKSTLLRLLHGQLRPAVGGAVTWPGLGDPADVWALRRQVGLVSAELLADYRYPVKLREAVASGLDSSFGLTRRLNGDEADRIEALLARFGLDLLADRALNTLSYGQLHRTMIARTLASGPRVVLLDEPWEGLDPATRALVADVMNDEIQQGLQIVCASHIDDRGIRFDRRLELTDGRISGECDSA
jgi:molybdate transport system ATP-binding protein